MSDRKHRPGGVIHTYQHYDPVRIPSPTQPPPDMVSPALEHMLRYGNMRRLTPEELARAVRLDPSQFSGLGPSIDMLMELLRERKRKILATYETRSVRKQARQTYRDRGGVVKPPRRFRDRYLQAFEEEQIAEMQRLLWFAAGRDEGSRFARDLMDVAQRLEEKYEVDELAAKYEFTGQTPLTVPEALAVKEELEKIDELLKQLEEARETAQIALIDMEALAEYIEPGDMEKLAEMQRAVENFLREAAERQGLLGEQGAFQLTPQAYRLFQGKLLERIFSNLQASRSGRHQGPVIGEGAVEMQQTKAYEFGDSITNMDIPQTFINSLLRSGGARPERLDQRDIEVHRTRNSPKCATVVVMDMSGSMRYDGQYINVKRMALALDGLIRSEYPGDYLNFVEMYTVARQRRQGEVAELMPKPVTIHEPFVRIKADLSDPEISEAMLPPHFTNIQHSLQMSRQLLALQDTPNRQVILITDGLPTAHFEGSMLYLLYPADARTEAATLREGLLCQREGITINIFLVPSWSQSEEDIRFAYRLAESTKGRVFFTAGGDLDRYVVWDYVNRKREIIA
ncbi:MAG: hypothetical protein RIC55_36985 [Pirellulaceae bacterium]